MYENLLFAVAALFGVSPEQLESWAEESEQRVIAELEVAFVAMAAAR